MNTVAAASFLITYHKGRRTACFADKQVIRRFTLSVVRAAYENLVHQGIMEAVTFTTIEDSGGESAPTYRLTERGRDAVSVNSEAHAT